MRLQYKIMTLVTTLVVTLVIVLTVVMFRTWFESIQKQVALDAMDQAVIISENTEVKLNMEAINGYLTVNRAVENLYLKTGIQYIYVINENGHYYAHPHPDRVNSIMNEGEIKGDIDITSPAYYYALTLDATVEGYAPIFTNGVKTGLVVVGIFNGRVIQTMMGQVLWLALFSFAAIGIGFFGAYLLSRNIKRDISGLEPAEIALLLNQKDMILENIGEGIIATNHKGQFILVNENARHLMDMPLSEGDTLSQLPFYPYFIEDHYRLKERFEFEWRISQSRIIAVSIKPLVQIHEQLGYLIKIDDMSIVRKRAEELTEMKQLTQALRAQNHEFMNKLHAISGLIQLEAYDGALDYIESITAPRQAMLQLIQERIKILSVGGLLLTKHSKLTEKQVVFNIDEDSSLEALPEQMNEQEVTSVLGNLIDNAEEAISQQNDKRIHVGIFQDNRELVLTVSDNGPGMTDDQLERCFERGFSSKGEGRGYGLDIVKRIIDANSGEIQLSTQNGFTVTVTIPYNFDGGNAS